ncbi:MAG TPA: hypothetical protein VNX21_07050 [Candidatus Thermoplasmatota archaeon]|nr:hypothetical protein [Candidatus Thermoplasmatota archaeon]
MLPRPFALVALLVLASLPSVAPPAAATHWTCAVTGNPLPPSPVGGVVGQAYTLAKNTAWSVSAFAILTSCAAVDNGVHAVNAQCVWLIGRPCLP